MKDSEFVSQVAACYYSFKNSYILIAGVEKNQHLIINAEITYTNKPIAFVTKQLLSYSMPVWINAHEPLKCSLGAWFAGELNFYQDWEIESLNDLYESLMAEKRIKAPGLTLSQNIEPCLKILLKALEKDLCCQQQGDLNFGVAVEPREVFRIIQGY